MSKKNKTNEQLAEELFDRAMELEGKDREDEEIALYKQSLELNPNQSVVHYNLGIIYKYQAKWKESLYHNQKAVELNSKREAAIWNLGIAATALHEWEIAREAWEKYGVPLEDGVQGEIFQDFGLTPVRLNPTDEGEVVWAKRLCPARTQIISVPFASTGFRHGDIVLNDGAPVGSRIIDDREYGVFNCLEMFKQSDYKTYQVELDVSTEEFYQALESLFEKKNIAYEDWTNNVRLLCRQCSEGTPHEHHDKDLKESQDEWQRKITLGIAANDENINTVEKILRNWKNNTHCSYSNFSLVLE